MNLNRINHKAMVSFGLISTLFVIIFISYVLISIETSINSLVMSILEIYQAHGSDTKLFVSEAYEAITQTYAPKKNLFYLGIILLIFSLVFTFSFLIHFALQSREEDLFIQSGKLIQESLNEIFLFDKRSFKFIYANRGALKNTQYSLKEIKTMGPLDLKDCLSDDDFSEIISPLLNGERERVSFQTQHKRKDGSFYDIDVNLQTGVFDENDVIVAVINDITELNIARQNLRNERDFAQSLVKATPNLVISLDRDNHINFVNEATLNFFETTDSAVRNISFKKLINLTSKDNQEKLQNALASSDEDGYIEIPIADPQCNERIFMWHINKLRNSSGGIERVILTGFDVTSEKEKAALEIEKHKLQSLGTIAGGIAHEINNVIQPIILLSEEIKKHEDMPQEKLREHVEVIIEHSLHARNIVEDVLLYARKASRETRNYDASILIKDVMRFMREVMPTSIQIQYEFSDDIMGKLISVDKTGFLQVFLNLFKNASQALDDTGTVKIEVRTCLKKDIPSDMISANYILINLIDEGPGIDQKHIKSVFDPFFTIKPEGKGTGLGLAVVYRLVKNWAGYINFVSEKDVGTTVSIYLPIVHNPEK